MSPLLLLSLLLCACSSPADAKDDREVGRSADGSAIETEAGGIVTQTQQGLGGDSSSATSGPKRVSTSGKVPKDVQASQAGADAAVVAQQQAASGGEDGDAMGLFHGLLKAAGHVHLPEEKDGHSSNEHVLQNWVFPLYSQAFKQLPLELRRDLQGIEPPMKRIALLREWKVRGSDPEMLASMIRNYGTTQGVFSIGGNLGPQSTLSGVHGGVRSSDYLAASDFLALNPKDKGARAARAVAAYKDADYKTAREDAAIAMKDGPARADLLTAYAGSNYHLGDYAEARRAAEQALRLDPKSAEATAVLKLAQTRAPQSKPLPDRDLFGADRSAEEPGADAAPGRAWQGAEPSIESRGPSATAEEISRVENERLKPDAQARSVELSREAGSRMKVKDFAGAAEAATKALAADPRNAQALVYRSMAHNRLGDYVSARSDADAALRLAPASTPALLARAYAENRQRDYPPALEDSNAVLSRDPRNSFGYLMRAYAQAGLGRSAEMRASLESAAAFNPAYRPMLERALQLPEGKDALLLFEGDALPGLVAPEPPARRLPWWPFAAGAGLAAAVWGLLRLRGRSAGGASAPASAGTIPSGYSVVRSLGAGGMGEVYEAKDLALERRVAVKRMREELRRDPRERARFLEEARLVARLRHPGIVEIYSILESGEDVYLIFEYVEGRTLSDLLAERRRLSLDEARELLRQVCGAVEHAHANGVVHRDLKPANIMLVPEGRAKVMDFGIAHRAQEALTRQATATVVGTPPYMAPEQELGRSGRESDVFALGVLLYEMLTGELPFQGTPTGMLMAKREGRFAPASVQVPGLPAGIDGFLSQALAAEPHGRFKSPAEFSSALDRI